LVFELQNYKNIFIPVVKGLVVTILSSMMFFASLRIFFPSITDVSEQDYVDQSAVNIIVVAIWGISIFLGIIEGVWSWNKRFGKHDL
jgi:hypothetical protein